MIIPDNFNEFLFWFKEVTERSWAREDAQTDPHYQAKWIGMTVEQIKDVEESYDIKFPPDHSAFLNILHTIHTRQKDNENPFFFNWLEDEAIVRMKLSFPCETIAKDSIWLNDWGVKPHSIEAIRDRFNEWYKKAPQLIPVFGHRYLVSQPYKAGNPVLSVMGSDTIIYGWNLKEYLICEFAAYMPDTMFIKRRDKEDGFEYSGYIDEIQDLFDTSWAHSSYANIPYWGELLQYNEGSWRYQPGKE